MSGRSGKAGRGGGGGGKHKGRDGGVGGAGGAAQRQGNVVASPGRRRRQQAPPSGPRPSEKEEVHRQQDAALLRSMEEKREAMRRHREAKRENPKAANVAETLVVDGLTGSVKKVPDIDRYWILLSDFSVDLVPFVPMGGELAHASMGDGCGEAELYRLMTADVRRVLALPFHVFWSHVMFNGSLREFVVSFLPNGRRGLTQHRGTDVGARDALVELAVFVFQFVQRLCELRESVEDFLEPQFHARAVFGGDQRPGFFTIPRVMDFCALYSPQNAAEVRRLVSWMCGAQPELLLADLEVSAISSCGIFRLLSQRLSASSVRVSNTGEQAGAGGGGEDRGVVSVPGEPAQSGDRDRIVAAVIERYTIPDLVAYLTDMAWVIVCFVKIVPPAAHDFWQHGMVDTIASFIDGPFRELRRDQAVEEELEDPMKLQGLEGLLLSVVQAVMEHIFFDFWKMKGQSQAMRAQRCPTCATRGQAEVSADLYGFLNPILVRSAGVPREETFLALMTCYFDLLGSLTAMDRGSVDDAQLSFVRRGIAHVLGVKEGMRPVSAVSAGSKALEQKGQLDIDSGASELQEMFPQLDSAALQAIVAHYEGNIERATDAILSESLPSQLAPRRAAASRRPVRVERFSEVDEMYGMFEVARTEAKDFISSHSYVLEYDDDFDDQYEGIPGVPDSGTHMDSPAPSPAPPTLQTVEEDAAPAEAAARIAPVGRGRGRPAGRGSSSAARKPKPKSAQARPTRTDGRKGKARAPGQSWAHE